LRRQGFAISVEHHLRLQLLLTRLAGECAPEDLKTLLCPLFATSRDEQMRFHGAFDSYFELFKLASASTAKDSQSREAAASFDEAAISPRRSNRSASIQVAVAILIIAAIILAARSPQVKSLMAMIWRKTTPTQPEGKMPTPAPTRQPSLQ